MYTTSENDKQIGRSHGRGGTGLLFLSIKTSCGGHNEAILMQRSGLEENESGPNGFVFTESRHNSGSSSREHGLIPMA
ncbi:hypothetical protein J7E73_24560 [Paenibacillus albidus]|nr:hypothetical protein [Paenibacillus albidus]